MSNNTFDIFSKIDGCKCSFCEGITESQPEECLLNPNKLVCTDNIKEASLILKFCNVFLALAEVMDNDKNNVVRLFDRLKIVNLLIAVLTKMTEISQNKMTDIKNQINEHNLIKQQLKENAITEITKYNINNPGKMLDVSLVETDPILLASMCEIN